MGYIQGLYTNESNLHMKNSIVQDVLEAFTFCFSHAPRAHGSSSTWQSTPSGPWHGHCGLQAPAWTSISLSCTWASTGTHLCLWPGNFCEPDNFFVIQRSPSPPSLVRCEPRRGRSPLMCLPHPFSCSAKVFCILQSLFYHNYLIVHIKLSMFKSRCSFCLLIVPRLILC